MMEVVRTVKGMHELSALWRIDSRRIGLVPTMGYFHEGHLSLMRASVKDCDFTVVSLFVNPTQFGQNEDLDAYPRDLERDLKLAEAADVDVVFTPDPAEMYPQGFRTYVKVDEWSDRLCGVTRPIHFRGVTTICCKLFNIVQPHRAYFGQKDAQQALIVRRMATDLNLPLEIVTCPTVRESDGLAMSSRNVYLNPDERPQALCLQNALLEAKRLFDAGECDAAAVRAAMERTIAAAPLAKLDFIAMVSVESLDEIRTLVPGSLIALAVFFGKTRLIDNIIL